MKVVSIIVINFILFSWAVYSQTKPQETTISVENRKDKIVWNLSEDDKIREIVFKKILENRILKPNKSYNYYLAIDNGKNPSKDLLGKLSADFNIIFKNLSDSLPEKDEIIPDNFLEGKGMLLRIYKLERNSKEEVKVSGGSYLGNIASDGCDYTLKKKEGKWNIISIDNCYISQSFLLNINGRKEEEKNQQIFKPHFAA